VLTVQTGRLFGPWDGANFAMRWLADLEAGRELTAPERVAAATYLPDLVHVALDLLIDGETGLWHLFNLQPVAGGGCAEMLAEAAGLGARDGSAREAQAAEPPQGRGPELMPSLAHALGRFVREAERPQPRRLLAAE
jgi:dTDP-4-dehydrorhamnose reductase